MEHPKAGLETAVDFKIIRGREGFIRHGNMPDPVTGECPDLMAQVTKAGHVEGLAELKNQPVHQGNYWILWSVKD